MSSNQTHFESFESAGIHGVNLNNTQQKVKCPECGDQRKNKRDKSLSVSPSKGTWNCHHCGWKGGLINKNFIPVEKKTYQLPQEIALPLGDEVIQWFADRGIEKRVLQYFKIGQSTQEKKSWINFPYYRDGKLINVKKRSRDKDFRLSAGAELIFFNLDAIQDKNEVVIVEGEPDCMAMYQASIFNAVSVPNGASKGSMKLEYLDNCWDKFEDKDKIILFLDNDEPGIALREELARRLGRDRCWIVECPEGCKDANEVLLKYGDKYLNALVKKAIPYPIKDVTTPKTYLNKVLEFYRNGFPGGAKIGFTEFDKLLSFRPGEMTIITGVPNSGKSAWLDQVLIRLSSRHQWRHAVLSREQWPHEIHVTKLTQIFTGKGLHDREMTEKMVTRANEFLDNHFFLFGIEDLTINGILEKARQLVLQSGIKSLVVDPWNTLTHDTAGFGTETEYVKEVLKQLTTFKDKYSVHIFLVAHPKKIIHEGAPGKKKYAVPQMYDISGSSHFYNMTDNGVCVYRNLGTRATKNNPLGDTVTCHVQKVRNFFIGQQGSTTFDYNFLSGCYSEEFIPFESEMDRWLSIVKQEGAMPIPISFGDAPPPLTDIFKLPVGKGFEGGNSDLVPNLDDIPPF